jgi:glyoxylase-like metal-dependent hydrolase (beta-lactamase superfamily II)
MIKIFRILLLVPFFTPQVIFGHDNHSLKTIAELHVEQFSDSVYLISAPLEGPNKENEGFIANTGFVITDDGVVVVDPGSSVQIGRELLGKISTVTALPVLAVFNTHVHGDHWLGNQAIVERYPDVRIYAHTRMLERLEEGEGEQWVRIMSQLTEGATDGTEVVPPNLPVDHGDEIAVGNTHFVIHYRGKAHSDTDIMIEVAEDKTMFMGDIVMVGRISSQPQDGDILGQIDAIDYAVGTGNLRYIPGHGKAGDADVAKE